MNQIMKHPKFDIFKGKNGDFYFRLTARNGQVIPANEGYSSKAGCKNGIESVKINVPNVDNMKEKNPKVDSTISIWSLGINRLLERVRCTSPNKDGAMVLSQ